MKNIRWRSILILTVLVASCAVGVYPIVAAQYGITTPKLLMDKQLKLGLDLKGGVHLVLRVERDDALKVETDTTVERLRDTLSRANVQSTKIEARSNDEFVVEGVTNDQAFRQAAAEADAVFTRSSGTGTYTFTMRPNIANQLREESVIQALQTIERRVNELGVTEPVVARQGAADQILVQLPGVTDVARAKQIIGSTATLELKLVEQGPFASQDLAMQAVNNNLPPDMTIISGHRRYCVHRWRNARHRVLHRQEGGSDYRARPPQRAAHARREQPAGRQLHADAGWCDTVWHLHGAEHRPSAGDHSRQSRLLGPEHPVAHHRSGTDNRQLYPGRSAGSVVDSPDGRPPGEADVSGRADDRPESWRRLDSIGRHCLGRRPDPDRAVHDRVLPLSGINAVVALIFNLVILLGLMAYIGAVMTLPGIAGFVLTMGIGVDSNVLIFERIKEELDAQRGVRAAINAGFSRVFLTLVDTHISALIAALFLIQFGTGPIRGFAYTLIIGLASNLFTSTFVSKTLFEIALGRRQQVAALSI
jgi:preprotein translocase subunit SecD